MLIYGKTPRDYIKQFRQIEGLKYLFFCLVLVAFLIGFGLKGISDTGPKLKGFGGAFFDALDGKGIQYKVE